MLPARILPLCAHMFSHRRPIAQSGHVNALQQEQLLICLQSANKERVIELQDYTCYTCTQFSTSACVLFPSC